MTTRATAVAGGVAVGYNSVPGSPAFYNDHAALWSADGTMTDLHPTAYAASQALAAADGKQAGFAIPMSFSGTRAVMWSGDLTSVVDLHPAGFRSSRATCVSAGEQAGYAANSLSLNHAILWRGSPESAVDLQPARWVETFVYGCVDGRQVGSALQTGGGNVHAVLWAGSADSVVDLNPDGIDASVAYGIGKDQQVGRGSGAATGGNDHALLWSGAAAGVVDLHPAAFVSSVAYASNGAQQAGAALALESGVMRSHAVVWSGTADSAVDLNQYLPQGMVEAVAWGIDADGNVAGTATDATGAAHAIVWRTSAPPAPKPAAPGALAAVSVTPGTIYGLNSVQGAVTLDAPAADGGLAIALASSDAGRVAVPASVTVPAGQLGATFRGDGGLRRGRRHRDHRRGGERRHAFHDRSGRASRRHREGGQGQLRGLPPARAGDQFESRRDPLTLCHRHRRVHWRSCPTRAAANTAARFSSGPPTPATSPSAAISAAATAAPHRPSISRTHKRVSLIRAIFFQRKSPTSSTAAPRTASFFNAFSASLARSSGNVRTSVRIGISAAIFRKSSPSRRVLLATLRITRSL